MSTAFASQSAPSEGATPKAHPLPRGGLAYCLAGLIGFTTAVNAMQDAANTLIESLATTLTGLGQSMTSALQTDSTNIQTFVNTGYDSLNGQTYSPSDSNYSAALQSLQQQATNDQTKYQTLMTPYNTETDNFTDAVKEFSSDASNFFSYCQSVISIMNNLSQLARG